MLHLIGRLKGWFAASALGLGFMTASAQEPPAPTVPPPPLQTTVDPESFRLWQTLLARDGTPYASAFPSDSARETGGVIVVQVEDSLTLMNELMLQSFPEAIYVDHGGMAASIIDWTADRMSGKDIQPLYINRPEHIGQWLLTPESGVAQSIFTNADIVCLSMATVKAGPQETAFSNGSLYMKGQVEAADDFWRRSKAILVRGAGNFGQMSQGLERANATLVARSDTMVTVGEVCVRDGQPVIAPWSSRGGVSVVAYNPFVSGFSYPLAGGEKRIRDVTEKLYQSPSLGTSLKAKDHFAQQLKNWASMVKERREYLAAQPEGTAGSLPGPGLTFLQHPLPLACPGLEDVEFEGKSDFLRDVEWQAEHPEETRRAFINALIASLPFRAAQEMTDKGHIVYSDGTSYTAPVVAGMLAHGRETYPELHERDLVGALLYAAEPVRFVQKPPEMHMPLFRLFEMGASEPVPRLVGLEYRNNGRNLLFNCEEAGYGLPTEQAYNDALLDMSALLAQDPARATREEKAETDSVSFTDVQPAPVHGYIDYPLQMTDDIVALRANLSLRFSGGPVCAPGEITLISPAGASVRVSPTRVADSDPFNFSLPTTDGFAGNYTAGTWIVRVPERTPLDGAQLTVEGSQREGLFDVFLKNKVDGNPPTDIPAYYPPSPEMQNFPEMDDSLIDGILDDIDWNLDIQLSPPDLSPQEFRMPPPAPLLP